MGLRAQHEYVDFAEIQDGKEFVELEDALDTAIDLLPSNPFDCSGDRLQKCAHWVEVMLVEQRTPGERRGEQGETLVDSFPFVVASFVVSPGFLVACFQILDAAVQPLETEVAYVLELGDANAFEDVSLLEIHVVAFVAYENVDIAAVVAGLAVAASVFGEVAVVVAFVAGVTIAVAAVA